MRLTRLERALLGSAGLACVLTCVAGPRDAGAVFFPHSRVEDHAATVAADGGGAAVTIVRDPFVAEAEDDAPGRVPERSDEGAIGAIPVLPPNGAVAHVPLGQGPAGCVIHAIVTGERPSALVSVADRTSIVRPGDALLGKRIAAIDAAGIVLEGGARLPFEP
jgi:hypothetical protein